MINHIEGDCIKVMPTLKKGSFDLILTDPPYAMPATYYSARNASRRWSDSSIIQSWWRLFLDTALPLLTGDGVIAVFSNATALCAFYPEMYERMTLQVAVWDKISLGMGVPLRNQMEFIIVGHVGKGYVENKGTSNIFRHKRVQPKDRVHLAQKPTSLISELVKLFCPPSGNVLDPFAGSRVVASACLPLGMSCTTIEWDDSYTETPAVPLLS